MMTTPSSNNASYDEFRELFVKVFSLDEATTFNQDLLDFVSTQNMKAFVETLQLLCDTDEKKALIPVIVGILPKSLQTQFSFVWDLVEKGYPISDPNVHKLFFCNVLYLGSGGLPYIPKDNKDDRELMIALLKKIVNVGTPQPAVFETMSDSVRIMDDINGHSLSTMSRDCIVFQGKIPWEIEEEELKTEVAVVVHQDPIYELLVVHYFSCSAAGDVDKIVESISNPEALLLASPSNTHADLDGSGTKENEENVHGDEEEEEEEDANNAFKALSKPGTFSPNDVLAKVQMDRKVLTAGHSIGAGQFGTVYLATLKEDPTTKYAVKMLRKDAASSSNKTEFKHEAEVTFILRHEHIVHLAGVCMLASPWLIVLEYVRFGNLKELLQGCLSLKYRLRAIEHITCCRQLASALAYVHKQGFVHMDIAARNILVDSHLHIKLSDFGQTQRKNEDGEFVMREMMRLSVRWMAPETLFGAKRFSETTDIWAFAVTCWEIFMYGRLPFKSMKTHEARDMIKSGKATLKNRLPTTCPKPLWAQLITCWNQTPSDRPTFEVMETILTNFESSLKEDEGIRDIGAIILEKMKQRFDAASST
eukprot:m.15527 g.15527  ORF g.15527 m.15527 type:complete len:591 (+) comp4488_c0_seq1:44-1816(+)